MSNWLQIVHTFLMLRLCQASDSSPLENIVQLISGEFRGYRRYIQDKESDPSFHVALEQYMASPHATTVREAGSAAIRAYEEAVATATHTYEEAVRTAVHPYQGKLPSWITKLSFESFKRKAKKAKESFEWSQAKEKESLCSRAKVELIEAVLEIALNHHLLQHTIMITDALVWRGVEVPGL
ncbi:uncharacterized protein F5147DRAFT_655756 [Suillus discolor]|uniref:Uncharacterized protein n=1 Tax=Suillus discolor TaxID=1912936 RepID=A0A9P7F1A8_9AGAM|nr:uncharacterized protein F5147DRAFT_655756 [Suillus discolor]KAG2099556.1 hypothetical protein F5147DRAFT_655756 [Suillus discolor]